MGACRKMEKILIFLGVFFLTTLNLRANTMENLTSSERHKKILNLFTVVRFPNTVCAGNNGFNGTCYSAEECETRGGNTGGTCGGGYGICCTFTLGCGETSSENCTYFQSGGQEVGQCRIKICPCSDNICQLRLDFSTFVITGPETTTTTAYVTKCGGKDLFELGQCQTDIFSVTAPGNNAPPVICGINSNEHMFVDSSDQCNDIGFNIGAGTSTLTRSWTIEITQYDCNYDNLAPDGCTLYFFGATQDLVKTYNFDGGQHLASQDRNICVRRERGTCQICWSTTAEGDFEVSSGMTGATGTVALKSACCSYGTACTKTTGFDCAIIPSPSKTGGTSLVAGFWGICGGELGTEDGVDAAASVCSRSVPFNIRFLSDLYESDTEKAVNQNGFRLSYTLMGC